MHWYLDVLKKYVEFNGRAGRQEFWMFALFNFIIAIVISVIEGVIGTAGIIGSLYWLGVLLPSLGVSVRRLHDTGRSGWFLLIGLIPIVGFIVLLVFYIQEGNPGDNEHGANPTSS